MKGAFRKPNHFTVPYLTKVRMKRVSEFWEMAKFEALCEQALQLYLEVTNKRSLEEE